MVNPIALENRVRYPQSIHAVAAENRDDVGYEKRVSAKT